MGRLTGVLHVGVGVPAVLQVNLGKPGCASKHHPDCADCTIQHVDALREEVRRLEAAIARGIEALDRVGGDPDMELEPDQEADEDLEPTLGWNEKDAPKDFWLTDGGHDLDDDND
jgi:hypothetical protein